MNTLQGARHLRSISVLDFSRSIFGIALFLFATPVPAQELSVASAKPEKADAIVSSDGSGTQTNLQSALDAAPNDSTNPYLILIKPGIYKGHVSIPANKPNLILRGEAGATAKTVVTDGHNINALGPDGKKLGTPDSATVLVRARNFTAENITFENTAGNHGQALAMYVAADRAIFRNCRFLGWQDTLRADAPRGGIGRQYFTNCEIVGHVDFIYAAGTSVFDRCHIHCLADGYITAASTPENVPFGYVFLNCRITAEPIVKGVYLGRPWRPFAATAFLNTEMPEQIRPEGWNNWRNAANEKTARYAEYHSTGPGARPEARVKWARQLSDEEAKIYTVENILKGDDGWNPTRGQSESR
ncbi:MAG TPA: pectinesterase family protein [Verrucomicrobiae bacterium]|nr:pectinesterase family protein [Verrucomicrobiae bacterium]